MNFIKEFVDSVLIVDDKEDEIIGLKKSLEAQDIWVTHCLPETLIKRQPIRHRTLLFLDLHLNTDEEIISILSKYTRPILQKHFSNNRAYGIVIWSLHDDEISMFCEKIIEDTITNERYSTPVFIINLEKNKYIQKNDFSTIIEDLNRKLLESPAASFFMSWSISVTKSISNVISDFFSLSPDFMDKKNGIIKNLYLLAKNYTGLPKEQLVNYPLYQDAYKSFDELIYSSLTFQQKSNFIDIFKKYKYPSKSNFSEEILTFAKINEKTFIENILAETKKHIIPGSVYEIVGDNKYLSVPDKPDTLKSIAIELTPPCDFSNKKLHSKLIGGFIVELPKEQKKINVFIKQFRRDSTYIIWPILTGSDKAQLMCFDFRCLLIISDSTLKNSKKYKLIFRVKHSLFSDILQKFSSHSARLGIASLKPEI